VQAEAATSTTAAAPGGGAGPVATLASVDGDGVLVARLVAGDDGALEELFDRYAPFVLGLARRVVRNSAVAEDVVQDVFAGLWSHPDRFDPARGSLRAYLGVQAYRRAVDAVRRDTRRRTRESWWAEPALAGSGVAVDLTDGAALAEVVRAAIARLPEEQRAAVELVYWHGHTHREVAAALAIPEGTAKSRLRLAQAKLAEWLAPQTMEPV
jgi:RNA polymerase sigma-70 factor (ECF subfamily)